MVQDLIFKEESYKFIGLCMEVHKQLGKDFNEVVYDNALEIEFIDNKIYYSRERCYATNYKGNTLSYQYKANLKLLSSFKT